MKIDAWFDMIWDSTLKCWRPMGITFNSPLVKKDDRKDLKVFHATISLSAEDLLPPADAEAHALADPVTINVTIPSGANRQQITKAFDRAMAEAGKDAVDFAKEAAKEETPRDLSGVNLSPLPPPDPKDETIEACKPATLLIKEGSYNSDPPPCPGYLPSADVDYHCHQQGVGSEHWSHCVGCRKDKERKEASK